MKRIYKLKQTVKTTVNINGIDYNLGNLYTTIRGYCVTSKKNKISFQCLLTGKTFTDTDSLSKHLVKTLISNKKIRL